MRIQSRFSSLIESLNEESIRRIGYPLSFIIGRVILLAFGLVAGFFAGYYLAVLLFSVGHGFDAVIGGVCGGLFAALSVTQLRLSRKAAGKVTIQVLIVSLIGAMLGIPFGAAPHHSTTFVVVVCSYLVVGLAVWMIMRAWRLRNNRK